MLSLTMDPWRNSFAGREVPDQKTYRIKHHPYNHNWMIQELRRIRRVQINKYCSCTTSMNGKRLLVTLSMVWFPLLLFTYPTFTTDHVLDSKNGRESKNVIQVISMSTSDLLLCIYYLLLSIIYISYYFDILFESGNPNKQNSLSPITSKTPFYPLYVSSLIIMYRKEKVINRFLRKF